MDKNDLLKEIHKVIRQVVKDYAGPGILCDKEDGIEYAKEILNLISQPK